MPSVVEPLAVVVRRVPVVVSAAPIAVRRSYVEPLAVGGYLLVLSYVLLRLAAQRLFWFDELFTLHLARSPLTLWSNLAAGVDLNPPLLYLLTALSVGVFGEVEWAVRLPAVVGAVGGSLGLYLFVRHRRGPLEAFLAMGVLAASAPVWVYFFEARPYGLAVGFTAAALVCWQRRWSLGFAFAVVLGMLSHYYFVVPLAAFGLAELVRIVQHRKLQRGIAAGFLAAVVTLGALYPLWGSAPKAYTAGFWAKVKFNRVAVEDAFNGLYRKEILLPVALALVVGVVAGRRREDTEPYPVAEAVALAALAAGPVLGVAVGAELAGGFFYRYVLPSMLGLAGVFAFVIGRAAGGHRVALLIATVGFLWFGLVGNLRLAVGYYRAEARQFRTTADLLKQQPGCLVVVQSPFDFARYWRYHREVNTAVIADVAMARKHTGADTVDRGLQSLATIVPVPVLTPNDVQAKLAAGERVYFLGTLNGWQHDELKARGVAFERIAERGPESVFVLNIE